MKNKNQSDTDPADLSPMGLQKVGFSALNKIEETQLRKGEEKKLWDHVKILRKCVQEKQLPSSKAWPNRRVYTGIVNSVARLDPLRDRRKKVHPLWSHALASVNAKYPKIGLIRTIDSFVGYAATLIPEKKLVPPSVTAFEATVGRRLEDDSYKPGPDFKNSKIAFEIYKGARKATGEHVAALVNLCSRDFRKLFPEQLNSPTTIRKEWRPLIEFAAALEIVREHQFYGKANGLWLRPFYDFVIDLENPEHSQVKTRLSDLDIVSNTERIKIERSRVQATLRKQRERERTSKEKPLS